MAKMATPKEIGAAKTPMKTMPKIGAAATPKTAVTALPAKPAYNRIGNLGAFAHPAKKKKKG
jgi:hypothetical protein